MSLTAPRRSLPLTRGECVDGPRPCPHTTCRQHLGRGKSESCALDVAERDHPPTLEEVGDWLGLTRERVRQIEVAALDKVDYRIATLNRGGVVPRDSGKGESAAEQGRPCRKCDVVFTGPRCMPCLRVHMREYMRRRRAAEVAAKAAAVVSE